MEIRDLNADDVDAFLFEHLAEIAAVNRAAAQGCDESAPEQYLPLRIESGLPGGNSFKAKQGGRAYVPLVWSQSAYLEASRSVIARSIE